MKTRYTVALSMLAGAAIGGAVIQGLHAEAKPPVYYYLEIDVSNPEAYMKEYAPLAQASVKAAGGRQLAIGGPAGAKLTPIEGAPPPSRVALQVWDSIEQIQTWFNSPYYKEARKIGDQYAKFRSFAVEGVSQ